MEAKVFDIVSVGGTMAVLAVKLSSGNQDERRITERQGFSRASVILVTLKPRPLSATYDSHDWYTGEGGVHADWPMKFAHEEIESRWDELQTGDLIDVSEAENPHPLA